MPERRPPRRCDFGTPDVVVRFRPDDAHAALRELANSLHLLPVVSPVARLWLRDGLRAWLSGAYETIDQALGISAARQPRQRQAALRHAHLRAIARECEGSAWNIARQVLLIIAGTRPTPCGLEATVTALLADPKCPRSLEHVYRVLKH